MVVVGTYQIGTRFIFNSPSTVSEELLTYSFAWMALLSAAYIFGKRDHMRMGFVADKVTGTAKKVLEICCFRSNRYGLWWDQYHGSYNDTDNSISSSNYGSDLHSTSIIWIIYCNLWNLKHH